MPNPHTQALLDEVRAPRIATRASAEDALLQFLPALARLAQQASQELTLAQTAEIAEEDDELRGKFELYVQCAATIKRITGEMERQARDLILTLRQRDRYDAGIRPAAVERGYADAATPADAPGA